MQQKLRTPIEKIGFTRIQFRRALVLADRIQRAAKFLLDIAELVMEFGLVFLSIFFVSQQPLELVALSLVIAGGRGASRILPSETVSLASASRVRTIVSDP
jgi:hypothetical protein